MTHGMTRYPLMLGEAPTDTLYASLEVRKSWDTIRYRAEGGVKWHEKKSQAVAEAKERGTLAIYTLSHETTSLGDPIKVWREIGFDVPLTPSLIDKYVASRVAQLRQHKAHATAESLGG
jgi:hypothetical protein